MFSLLIFKHHSGPPFTVIVNSSHHNCPVKSLSAYFVLRGQSTGPLFVFQDSKPVSSQYFSHIFKRCLVLLDLDCTYFKPHSFRIGAATHAFSTGASMETIQQLGRWKSNAFRKYIRVNCVNTTVV